MKNLNSVAWLGEIILTIYKNSAAKLYKSIKAKQATAKLSCGMLFAVSVSVSSIYYCEWPSRFDYFNETGKPNIKTASISFNNTKNP